MASSSHSYMHKWIPTHWANTHTHLHGNPSPVCLWETGQSWQHSPSGGV